MHNRAKTTWSQSSRRRASVGKVGFRIARQGKHIVMTNGSRTLTIPRHNPVNAYTMGRIVQDAGLIIAEFRGLF